MILFSFRFYLYLTSKGYSLSSCSAFYFISFLLIYVFAFLLCAFANSGCHRPPLLKVNLNTGDFYPLRFLDNALIKSSGSLLTICYIKFDYYYKARWIYMRSNSFNVIGLKSNYILG